MHGAGVEASILSVLKTTQRETLSHLRVAATCSGSWRHWGLGDSSWSPNQVVAKTHPGDHTQWRPQALTLTPVTTSGGCRSQDSGNQGTHSPPTLLPTAWVWGLWGKDPKLWSAPLVPRLQYTAPQPAVLCFTLVGTQPKAGKRVVEGESCLNQGQEGQLQLLRVHSQASRMPAFPVTPAWTNEGLAEQGLGWPTAPPTWSWVSVRPASLPASRVTGDLAVVPIPHVLPSEAPEGPETGPLPQPSLCSSTSRPARAPPQVLEPCRSQVVSGDGAGRGGGEGRRKLGLAGRAAG